PCDSETVGALQHVRVSMAPYRGEGTGGERKPDQVALHRDRFRQRQQRPARTDRYLAGPGAGRDHEGFERSGVDLGNPLSVLNEDAATDAGCAQRREDVTGIDVAFIGVPGFLVWQ